MLTPKKLDSSTSGYGDEHDETTTLVNVSDYGKKQPQQEAVLLPKPKTA